MESVIFLFQACYTISQFFCKLCSIGEPMSNILFILFCWLASLPLTVNCNNRVIFCTMYGSHFSLLVLSNNNQPCNQTLDRIFIGCSCCQLAILFAINKNDHIYYSSLPCSIAHIHIRIQNLIAVIFVFRITDGSI